jgi:EmrB/QacA subfamily drug resistance transporter
MGANGGAGGTRLLGGMALASGITSVPSTAIVLALPTIHHHWNASLTELEWTVTGYLLAYSGLLVAAGRLADMFGRVRVLVVGTLIYMAASVVGALANDPTVLIGSLAVAGAGAAGLTPASLAIVTNAFRDERRGAAVGIWGAATAVCLGLAPAIGGVLTAEVSWRWILWLNVVAGALILLAVRGAVESIDELAGEHIDFLGFALSFTALGAFTLALNEAPTPWAFDSSHFLAMMAGGAILLVAFVVLERRLANPLIDVAMFARRHISGAVIAVFVLDFTFGVVLFFLPLYLEELLGFGAAKAGLLLLPASAATMVAMPIGGRLFERVGPLPPIVAGMTLAAVGTLLLGRISTSTHYAGLWPPLVLLGLGIGCALTPLNLCALNPIPVRNHGAVGAIIATLAGLGATFGVALSAAVFELLQTNDTIRAAASRGLHISASTARTLDGLLPGTPDASRLLAVYPPVQHGALHASVREGFISAISSTMRISLGLVIAGAVFTVALIRSERVALGLAKPALGRLWPGLAPRP